MKFKYIIWLIALIITAIICSCSTRKTNLELNKSKTSHESELKIDAKEAVLDKGIVEKLTSDNSYTIVIKEYFGQLTDSCTLSGNKPIFRETTISKTDKKTSEKENKDLTSNKTLQGTENKKGTSVSKIKNKQVERTISSGKIIGVSILLAAFGLAFWAIYRQIKKAKRLKKLKEALIS